MSCHECGFCQADLPTLENIAVDTRSRGNYRIAIMLDQALERCGILHENLQVNNREYLKNISRMVKEQSASDVCTNLLRDAKHIVETTKGRQSSEPTRREMGFGNMVVASRGGLSTPTPKHTEPELRSSSVFIRMLDESKKGTDEIEHDETKHAIERVIQNNHEDIIPRNGIITMFERVITSRTRDEPEPEIHGGYGFLAMLDGASRGTGTGEILDNRSHVRRGMGFRAMLDGASRGTE